MADNIVGGLFGINPAQYDMQQRQQRQQEFARDFQAFQLSPLEQSKLAILQGTRAFGRGVGQLLGGGDPELQKVSAIKQLSSQFDLTSATGLREFARALQAQYPQEAMMAAKRADELETSGLGRKKIEAETTLADARAEAALREKTIPTSGLGKLLFEKDALLKAGLPANDPKVLAYDKAIAAEGEGRGTKIIMPGEAQNKILRDKRAGKLLDLEDTALAAQDTLQTVRDFKRIVGTAFTGAGSGAKLTAGQFANALGLEVSGTSETEQLNQLFAGLTTGQAKNLKGALSDKDLKFLKEAVGTSGLTLTTLQNVISRIEREAMIDSKTFDLASQYEGDYSKMNLVEIKKKAQAEVNSRFDKQKRLQELRDKQAK
jgi:hypothetical protein